MRTTENGNKKRNRSREQWIESSMVVESSTELRRRRNTRLSLAGWEMKKPAFHAHHCRLIGPARKETGYFIRPATAAAVAANKDSLQEQLTAGRHTRMTISGGKRREAAAACL